jgi:hypothetical protein
LDIHFVIINKANVSALREQTERMDVANQCFFLDSIGPNGFNLGLPRQLSMQWTMMLEKSTDFPQDRRGPSRNSGQQALAKVLGILTQSRKNAGLSEGRTQP